MAFEEDIEIHLGFEKAGVSSFLDWFEGRLAELQASVAGGGEDAFGAGELSRALEAAISNAKVGLQELGYEASTLIDRINTVASAHPEAVRGYVDADPRFSAPVDNAVYERRQTAELTWTERVAEGAKAVAEQVENLRKSIGFEIAYARNMEVNVGLSRDLARLQTERNEALGTAVPLNYQDYVASVGGRAGLINQDIADATRRATSSVNAEDSAAALEQADREYNSHGLNFTKYKQEAVRAAAQAKIDAATREATVIVEIGAETELREAAERAYNAHGLNFIQYKEAAVRAAAQAKIDAAIREATAIVEIDAENEAREQAEREYNAHGLSFIEFKEEEQRRLAAAEAEAVNRRIAAAAAQAARDVEVEERNAKAADQVAAHISGVEESIAYEQAYAKNMAENVALSRELARLQAIRNDALRTANPLNFLDYSASVGGKAGLVNQDIADATRRATAVTEAEESVDAQRLAEAAEEETQIQAARAAEAARVQKLIDTAAREAAAIVDIDAETLAREAAQREYNAHGLDFIAFQEEELARLREAESAATNRRIAATEAQAARDVEIAEASAAASAGGAGAVPVIAAGGGGLLASAGTIAPLLAGFSIYRQIREGIKDATDLEKVLAVTRVQMQDIGQGADFAKFKAGILDISTTSGVAAAQVAQTAQQFQAAFGGSTVRALNETQSAMEAVRVTGLSLSEVVNVFLALQESFRDTGVTISDLTDKAIGLQQRTGTKASETLTFASQIAPIASESGFTAQDVEALGATIEKFSGKSAQANAEALGRVFSGIQGKAVQLIEFLQANAPQIADAVAHSLNSGDIKGAFETLLANYDNLGQSQQQQLLYTLAGRREAATLSAAFSDSAQVLDELHGKYDDTGKAQQTFNEVQDTLGQQVAQLSASFQKLGVDIYDAGLKQILEGIAAAITGIVQGADVIASVFSKVNSATHGLVGELALLLAALRGIEFFADSRLFAKLLGGLGVESIAGANVAAASAKGGVGLTEATGLGAVLGKFNPIAGVQAGVAGFQAEQAGIGLGSAGLAESIGTGFSAAFTAAGPGLVLLGALAANTLIGKFSEGFQENYDKDLANRLGGKHTIDTLPDIDKALAGRNNIGGGAIQSSADLTKFLSTHTKDTSSPSGIESLLFSLGDDTLTPSQALDQAVRDHASEAQQLFDSTPGASSSQDIDTNIKALHDAENAQAAHVKAALEKLQGDSQLTQSFLDELNKQGKGGLLGPDPASKIEGLIQAIGKTGGDFSKLSGEDQVTFTALTEALPSFDKASGDIAAKLQAITDKAAAQDQIATDAVTAKQQLDDGVIGLGEYLVAAGKLGDSLKSLAEGGSDPKATAAYVKNQQEQSKEISDTLRHSTDFLIEARGIAGTDSPKQDVTDLTSLLNNPQFTDTADRLSATKALVTAIKKEKTYEASLVTDVKEKAAILASTDVLPKAGQEALYGEFLQYSLGFQTFLARALNGNTDLQQTISNLVAVQLANGASDVRTATIAADQIEITTLQNILATASQFAHLTHRTAETAAIVNNIKDIQEQLGTLVATDIPGFGNILGGSVGKGAGDLKNIPLPDFGNVGNPPDASAEAAARNQEKEDQLARLDIEAAKARGDAVRLAEIARERANIDLAFATTDAEKYQAQAAIISADQALTDAYVAHDAAVRDLAVAQGGDDPVQAAQAAVANAQEALANAAGPDAIIKAQADLARAQSALVRAVQAGVDAQFDLLIAIDNAGGDTVKAAQDSLAKLYTKLANADSLHLSEADREQLIGQIIAAGANVEQQIISEGESSIQTDLTLKRITKGQAIAELEALQAKAISSGATQKEIDQIAVEIQNLKGSLGQDFKFNLPSVLGLPNLYEAKRVDQTGGGAGYTDNRVVTVNINAQTNATATQIGQAVSDAIGPTRSIGPRTRRY